MNDYPCFATRSCDIGDQDMSCKTHRRVFKRESNPRPFSVSGKSGELNFSRSPARQMGLMICNVLNRQVLWGILNLEGEFC